MADYTCGRKFSGNISPTLRRPGCRNPEFLANFSYRPRPIPKALVVALPGGHSHWGRPLLVEKPQIKSSSKTNEDEIEKSLKQKPPSRVITPTIYELPNGPTNPAGWWHMYEPQTLNLNYMTSNSEYSRYPPNPYTMPVSYVVKDRSFTTNMMEFPFYRNRSLNVNYCN